MLLYCLLTLCKDCKSNHVCKRLLEDYTRDSWDGVWLMTYNALYVRVRMKVVITYSSKCDLSAGIWGKLLVWQEYNRGFMKWTEELA